MRPLRRVRCLLPIVLAVLWLAGGRAAAAPEGTLTIAMHFTPVTRWLDPGEGESTITPYFLLYALHDALLKPMPGVGIGAELGPILVDVQRHAHGRLHPAREREVPPTAMPSPATT